MGNGKAVLLPLLAPKRITCASQRLSLPSRFFVTQGLILGCLGPPKASRSSNNLNSTPRDDEV